MTAITNESELAERLARFGGALVSPQEAARLVQPGHRVMIPIGSQPVVIGTALSERIAEFRDGETVEISDCAIAAPFAFLEPGFPGVSSVVHEHWGGPVVRRQMRTGQHDYVPIPFSLRFKAFDEDRRTDGERRRADVVIVQVSPPDEHGLVTFGPNAWNQLRFVEEASVALAEINEHIVPSYGANHVAPVGKFRAFVLNSSPRRPYDPPVLSDADRRIAGFVGELLRDGDTIQVGAGAVPTAVVHGGAFDDRRDLGWHSEATIGGVIDLIRAGVFNGSRKTIDRGLAVATGFAGSPEQMEFCRMNPFIQTRSTDYLHNVRTIASLDNMVAINAAMLVDLTGQIAADSLGTEMIGGTGGQLEFAIGAVNSKGGRSITVLKAGAFEDTVSNLVPTLPEGTVVSVPRLFADTVVTEFGIARLWGKSVRERAQEMIAIAHPNVRDELRAKAKAIWR